jgi:hypothetical protein
MQQRQGSRLKNYKRSIMDRLTLLCAHHRFLADHGATDQMLVKHNSFHTIEYSTLVSYLTIERIVYGRVSGTAGVWVFLCAQYFVFVRRHDFSYVIATCTVRIAGYSCDLFSCRPHDCVQ